MPDFDLIPDFNIPLAEGVYVMTENITTTPECDDCRRGFHSSPTDNGYCRCCLTPLDVQHNPVDPEPVPLAHLIPAWIDLSNVPGVEALHRDRIEVLNTIEIGYLMERLRFHEINDDTAAHFYSRALLLGKIESPAIMRSDDSHRAIKPSDVFNRIGMKVTGVPASATVPMWAQFVSGLMGARWDRDARRRFRSYMRDMGGH